ncbi:MAG: hypothetical protein OEZ34_00230 [Spirochaetia bacterium]|nr:hypothetical protein [Spirochaetia bacterium]
MTFHCRKEAVLESHAVPSHNQFQFYRPDLKTDAEIKKYLKSNLIFRFGLQSDPLLNYMKKLDGKEIYSFYSPTESDKKTIQFSIDLLPPLIKQNLQERVIGIYFINHFISTGYTDWVIGHDGKIYSVILINPDVFKMNVSEILQKREKTCFQSNSSSVKIKIHAGKQSAFDYILLHEAVHSADYSHRISDIDEESYNQIKPFIKRKFKPVDTIWNSSNTPYKHFDFQNRENISFYGFRKGPHLTLDQAPDLYADLQKSPFASLYGSQYKVEDLAELVTMYHLSIIQGNEYAIEISSPKIRMKIHPLQSQKVKKRISGIRFFYSVFPEK